jgi:hypothetical protein
MPRYILTIRAGHEGNRTERASELNGDPAALRYASKLTRDLMQGDERADGSWLLRVSDETRPRVFAIPFFAACA